MIEKLTTNVLDEDQSNSSSQKDKTVLVELKQSNKQKVIISKFLKVFTLNAKYDTIQCTH